MIKSRILLEKKTAFCPIKIFCEKRDGHSKCERKKIIALHLKRVFAGTATNFSNNVFFAYESSQAKKLRDIVLG